MAIVAHWPLTGHTNDISGNGHHGTNVGVTWADGKVGQAGVFAGTGDGKGIAGEYVSVPYEVTDIRQYEKGCTYTFWINVDADAANRIALLYGGATIDHIEIYSDSKYFRTEAVLQNGYSFGSGGFPDIVKGTWSHFAIVFDTVSEGRPVRWYQNGKLFYTGSLDNGNNPGEEYFYFNAIGRSTGTASYNYAPSFKGKINDVRIYDEALSPKQIYDISKAKVLHYTFNDFQEPTENLVINPSDGTIENDGVNMIPSGKYHSNSSDYAVKTWDVVNTDSTGKSFTYSLYLRSKSDVKSTYLLYVNDGSGPDGGWWSFGSGNLIDEWQRIEFTRSNMTGTVTQVRLYRYNKAGTIDFADPQLEVKDHATEFTIGSRSAEVLDISSFGKHAQILYDEATPVWQEECKVGTGSYHFDNQRIKYDPEGTGPAIGVTDKLTLACFVKLDTIRESGFIQSDFYFSCGGDGKLRAYWYNTSSPGYHVSPNVLPINEWIHVAVTWTGTDCILYENGEEVHRVATSTPGRGTGGYLSIGAESYQVPPTSSRRINGSIDDVRIYATALSAKDILKLSQARFEENKNAEFYSKALKQNTYYDYSINNTNLARNGDAHLENNDNWSEFVYNSSEKCFTVTSGSKTVILDDFIKIKGDGFNNFDQYVLEAELKQPDIVSALSRYYFFIYCYDKNKQGIYYAYHYHRGGTETTLAATLNPGDTTVTVNDISNWYSDGTSNETHLKQIKVFSPTDEYPDYTYSRNRARYLSYSGNVITLKSAWTGPTIPAGSAICNTNDGGTYSYIGASNALMTQDWVKRKSNNTYTGSSSLRYGTEYVRIGFLINRNAGVETSYIRNLKFYNVTNPGQATEFDVDKLSKKQTGLLSLNNFSELGIMDKNLIFLKLLGDTIDDSGNGYNATTVGATDRTEGYYFDGTDDHIEVPYGANFNPYEDQLSVSMYIKPIDIAPQWMCVSTGQSRGNGDTGARFYVGNVGSGNLDWGIKGAGWAGGSGKFIMSADTWYHIAVTFDGHNARLYANGQLIETRLYTSYLFNGNIWIGNHDGSHPFPGYIKNFKVFNGVLTPQQVAIEYRLMNKEIIEKNNILYLDTISED